MAKTSKTASKAATSPRRFCSLPKSKPRVLNTGITGDRAKLILQNSNKWANGTVLRYYFYNKKTDGMNAEENGKQVWKTWVGTKEQMDVVRKAFDIWMKTGIGLRFTEVKDRKDAEIRIAFMDGDGSWSYIGRDILDKNDDPRTMNFGWNIAVRDRHNGIDTPVHEIGHTIGFPHEHQNPFAGIVWNKEAVYKNLGGPPNNWTRASTYENIIRKIGKKEVNGSTWDPNSIMHYEFEPGLVSKPEQYKKNGIFPAGGLSKLDIQYALFFYPKKNAIKDLRVQAMTSYDINADNSKQQNYAFTPTETREYTIQTIGQLDTVVVVSEKKSNGDLVKIAADDNSGSDKNALIKTKLTKGKNYLVKVKVYYKKPRAKTALMIS
jgi:hypothetical protein